MTNLIVSFIVNSWHYFTNPFKLQPLNELYFATVVDNYKKFNKKVDIKVIDLRELRKDKSLESKLIYSDIYIYWVAKTADYVETLNILEKIRQIYPSAIHVAGGTHIDNFPDICKNQFDSIVLGPGEESFIKIIDDYINKNFVNKIYKDSWEFVRYENYPFASREYLPEDSIVNTVLFEKYGKFKGTSALFSRGCNFKCAYCTYNVPKSIQMKSNSSIEKEIIYLKERYNIRAVNIRDEICIPLSSKISIPYLKTIGNTDVIWRGQTRIGPDKRILQMAYDSGCVELAIGVESVSQNVLNVVNKGQTIQKVKEFIKNCKSVEIKVKMCIILGLPGEPENIVNLTQTFIEDTEPDFVNISGFCPVPGSEIFNNYKYYGIKYIDNDWSKHAHLVYRFSDEEDFGLPFEYEEKNRWGKTFSRAEIINNIQKLQHYLQERGMCY